VKSDKDKNAYRALQIREEAFTKNPYYISSYAKPHKLVPREISEDIVIQEPDAPAHQKNTYSL